MNCTEILKARVTPEIKRQAKAVADRELLTEAAWLKRVVMKEIRSIERSGAGADHDQLLQIRRPAHDSAGRCKPVYVRISDDDRVLLESRAAARAMRPATYVSVLARAHLRALPLVNLLRDASKRSARALLRAASRHFPTLRVVPHTTRA